MDFTSHLKRIPPRWVSAGKFLVAGGSASFVNFLVRFPLSSFFSFDVAVSLAYMIGMAAGFALYRSWVFPGSSVPLYSQVLRFIAVNACGLFVVVEIASLCASALINAGPFSPEVAEAIAHVIGIGSGAIANFAGHSLITFADRVTRPQEI
jgi:energy-coupling factor transport system substrate-specific component